MMGTKLRTFAPQINLPLEGRIADGLGLTTWREMMERPGSKTASMVQGFFAKRTEIFLHREDAR